MPLGTNSRPLLIFHSNDLKKLSLLAGSGGALTFPDLTWNGGTIAGIPAMGVDTVSAGYVLLVDCSGLTIADLGLGLDASRNATLALESSPTPETASTVLEPLFARNLVAFRAEREFGLWPPPPSSVAALQGLL